MVSGDVGQKTLRTLSRNPEIDIHDTQQEYEGVWLPVMWKGFDKDVVLKER